MLRAVFWFEWRSAWRDRSLAVIALVFAILVAYATWAGSRFVAAEGAAMSAATAEHEDARARLRSETLAIAAGAPVKHSADPTNPAQVGGALLPHVAALPPAPLSIVAVGQRDVLPQRVELTTKPQLGSPDHHEAASPLRQSNGPFDLSFVLVFLLPLIVIATTYDLLSAERERGTLALVLSQPVSLRTFVLGKALQRLALLLGLAVVLSVAAPLALGASLTAPGAPLHFALYAALLFGYTLFWVSLSVVVNAWGRSSAGNALSLVGLWLALLVVVPGLASVAVDTLYPSPSRVELVHLARAAASDAEAKTTAMEGNHGQPLPADSGQKAMANQAAFEAQVAPVLEQFRQQRARQQAMVDRVRFLSPAILLSEGLADIAGGSASRHEDFTRQVDVFHAELKAYFFTRVSQGAALVATDYDAMPRFSYREPSDSALGGRVGVALLALFAAAAALTAIAMARLRRPFPMA